MDTPLYYFILLLFNLTGLEAIMNICQITNKLKCMFSKSGCILGPDTN